MKIKDLIEKLREYDDDCEVYCKSEGSDWIYNGDYSEEVPTTEEYPVSSVEAYVDWFGNGDKAVIIL